MVCWLCCPFRRHLNPGRTGSSPRRGTRVRCDAGRAGTAAGKARDADRNRRGTGRSVRHRGRPPAPSSPRGRTPRRASGRTPTPRRTSSAVATATGCWWSSRRTPPTRPPGPGVPGRLRLELSRTRRCGPPTPAHRSMPGSAGPRHAARVRQAGRDRHGRPLRRRLRRGARRQRRARRACRRPVACGSARCAPAPRWRRCPALAAEVDRREGGVPVLRLPWPVEGAPPEGFATEVVLPLRPGARADVASALAGLPAELLLALPGLAGVEIVVDGARPHARGRTLRRPGPPHRRRRGDRLAGRRAVRGAGGRARRRPAGRGARPARLDGHLGGAPRRGRRPRPVARAGRSCTRRRRATSRSPCRCG